MYYANCEWYVDMGEYNKPLCERNSLRPAKCSECSVYIRSIEEENEKLRELCSDLMGWVAYTTMGESVPEETCCVLEDRMSALGIEV